MKIKESEIMEIVNQLNLRRIELFKKGIKSFKFPKPIKTKEGFEFLKIILDLQNSKK